MILDVSGCLVVNHPHPVAIRHLLVKTGVVCCSFAHLDSSELLRIQNAAKKLCLSFEHRVSQVEPCAKVLDFCLTNQEDGFAFFVPENKWSSAFSRPCFPGRM